MISMYHRYIGGVSQNDGTFYFGERGYISLRTVERNVHIVKNISTIIMKHKLNRLVLQSYP